MCLHGHHVAQPTGKGQARWTMRWETALNAFGITFDGRLSAAAGNPTALVTPFVWQTRSPAPRRAGRNRHGHQLIVGSPWPAHLAGDIRGQHP